MFIAQKISTYCQFNICGSVNVDLKFSVKLSWRLYTVFYIHFTEAQTL